MHEACMLAQNATYTVWFICHDLKELRNIYILYHLSILSMDESSMSDKLKLGLFVE